MAALDPGTTVCVPAWNATAFLAETLAAIARQDVPGMRVLVSVDGADAATAAVCDPFLADARFARVVQPTRLGWVGNTNALIAAVQTEHVAIMPHDDLPADGWLAALHQVLAAHPAAIGAYADLEGFGTHEQVIVQPEITGGPLARRLKTLLRHYACVSYRGLFRLWPDRPRPLLPTGLPGDIAADTAWLMDLACQGELRRYPQVLVRKRYHRGNTHGGWSSLPAETGLSAGTAVLGHMHDRAMRGFPGGTVPARLLAAAALLRLLDCAAPLPLLRAVPLPQRAAAWLRADDGRLADLPNAHDVLAHPAARQLRVRLAQPACADRLAALTQDIRGSAWHAVLERLAGLAAEVGERVREEAVQPPDAADGPGGATASAPSTSSAVRIAAMAAGKPA